MSAIASICVVLVQDRKMPSASGLSFSLAIAPIAPASRCRILGLELQRHVATTVTPAAVR